MGPVGHLAAGSSDVGYWSSLLLPGPQHNEPGGWAAQYTAAGPAAASPEASPRWPSGAAVPGALLLTAHSLTSPPGQQPQPGYRGMQQLLQARLRDVTAPGGGHVRAGGGGGGSGGGARSAAGSGGGAGPGSQATAAGSSQTPVSAASWALALPGRTQALADAVAPAEAVAATLVHVAGLLRVLCCEPTVAAAMATQQEGQPLRRLLRAAAQTGVLLAAAAAAAAAPSSAPATSLPQRQGTLPASAGPGGASATPQMMQTPTSPLSQQAAAQRTSPAQPHVDLLVRFQLLCGGTLAAVLAHPPASAAALTELAAATGAPGDGGGSGAARPTTGRTPTASTSGAAGAAGAGQPPALAASASAAGLLAAAAVAPAAMSALYCYCCTEADANGLVVLLANPGVAAALAIALQYGARALGSQETALPFPHPHAPPQRAAVSMTGAAAAAAGAAGGAQAAVGGDTGGSSDGWYAGPVEPRAAMAAAALALHLMRTAASIPIDQATPYGHGGNGGVVSASTSVSGGVLLSPQHNAAGAGAGAVPAGIASASASAAAVAAAAATAAGGGGAGSALSPTSVLAVEGLVAADCGALASLGQIVYVLIHRSLTPAAAAGGGAGGGPPPMDESALALQALAAGTAARLAAHHAARGAAAMRETLGPPLEVLSALALLLLLPPSAAGDAAAARVAGVGGPPGASKSFVASFLAAVAQHGPYSYEMFTQVRLTEGAPEQQGPPRRAPVQHAHGVRDACSPASKHAALHVCMYMCMCVYACVPGR